MNQQTFTLLELQEKYGADWDKHVYLGDPVIPITKPVPGTFNDFDPATKNVYTQIYNIIKQVNFENFELWATGSRINGRWMTDQEAESFYSARNCDVIYSDFDFLTTAKNIPDQSTFNNSISGIGKASIGVQQGSTWKMIPVTP